MYVIRREFTESETFLHQRKEDLVLRALDRPSPAVSFRSFSSENEARLSGGEPYQLLFSQKGRYDGPPTHAVFAEWNLADPSRAIPFEESRRRLFELRRDVLKTFVVDWLLKGLEGAARYLVLGLYGDMEGATTLCRDHPEIRQFLRAHPAEQYSARDMTGLRSFRIVSGTGLE